jgi:hypothetical protein
VVQRHGPDAQRDFAQRRRGRGRNLDRFELAILDQLQCAHWAGQFPSNDFVSIGTIRKPDSTPDQSGAGIFGPMLEAFA